MGRKSKTYLKKCAALKKARAARKKNAKLKKQYKHQNYGQKITLKHDKETGFWNRLIDGIEPSIYGKKYHITITIKEEAL